MCLKKWPETEVLPNINAFVQAAPDRLPTARQEMILQQLAALRQVRHIL